MIYFNFWRPPHVRVSNIMGSTSGRQFLRAVLYGMFSVLNLQKKKGEEPTRFEKCICRRR